MNLIDSQFFTRYEPPDTGVPIYILTHKVAPLQEAFYFVNSGMTEDARYLWFYCGFPPSGSGGYGRTLGVVDAQQGEVRHFPDTQFQSASPFVDPKTGEVTWASGSSLWTRGPDPDAETRHVNALPDALVRNRRVTRMATHLTRSADGTAFFIDAAFGLQWVMGALPVDGGDFELWHRFDRNYNHAQFSPTNPDLALFAQENHSDPITGLRFGIEDRMWLIERGEDPQPVFDAPTRVTHEWWDPGGESVWCVWGNETWRTDLATRTVETIEWPVHCWHAHATRDAAYLICDSNERFYRGCPSSVHFMNRDTGKVLRIVDNPEMKGYVGANYHIDPHPRFCGSDRYVVFTTTVRGEVDLAVIKTADLIDRTS